MLTKYEATHFNTHARTHTHARSRARTRTYTDTCVFMWACGCVCVRTHHYSLHTWTCIREDQRTTISQITLFVIMWASSVKRYMSRFSPTIYWFDYITVLLLYLQYALGMVLVMSPHDQAIYVYIHIHSHTHTRLHTRSRHLVSKINPKRLKVETLTLKMKRAGSVNDLCQVYR